MKIVEDYGEVSRLVMRRLGSGVLTNNYMLASEYRALIADGSLFMHEWSGGLLLLCRKDGRHLLKFSVSDADSLPDASLPLDTVTEIAYKPSGVAAAERAVSYLEKCGFATLFGRIRMTRQPGGEPLAEVSGYKVYIADDDRYDDIRALLRGCFDIRTGCLPDDSELFGDIAAGRVLCVLDDSDVTAGLLRYEVRASSLEICHLAVREDMRGRGVAGSLIRDLVGRFGDKSITVWLRDGYAPAQRAYVSAGFVLDGLRSFVMAIICNS